jgi:heme-degrading monooxygenase HmoA
VPIVLFRSRLREESRAAYEPVAERMEALARAMPGFVSIETFTAEDGERLSIVEFDSHEQMAAWREHPEHRIAQRRGREEFYAEYRLSVLERVSERVFRR